MLENVNWKRIKALLSAGAILVTLNGCRKPVEVEVTPTPTPSESVEPTQTKQPVPSHSVVPSAEPSQSVGDIQPIQSEAPTVEPTEVPTATPVVTEKPVKIPVPATPTPSQNVEIIMPTPSGDVVIVVPTATPSEVPTAAPTANPNAILLQNEAKSICVEIKKLIDESILAKDKIYKNVGNIRDYYNVISAKFKELKAIQTEVDKAYAEATGTAKTTILKEKQKVDAEVEKVRQELENIANELAKLVDINQQYSKDGKINDFTSRNNVLQNNISNISDASQLNDYQKLLEEVKEYASKIKSEKGGYDATKQTSISTKVEESLKTATAAKETVSETIKKQNSTNNGRRPSGGSSRPVTPTEKPDEPTTPPTEKPDEPTTPPTEKPDEPTTPPTEKPDEPTTPPTEKPDEPTKDPDTTFDEDGNPDNIYGYVIIDEGPTLKLTM